MKFDSFIQSYIFFVNKSDNIFICSLWVHLSILPMQNFNNINYILTTFVLFQLSPNQDELGFFFDMGGQIHCEEPSGNIPLSPSSFTLTYLLFSR